MDTKYNPIAGTLRTGGGSSGGGGGTTNFSPVDYPQAWEAAP